MHDLRRWTHDRHNTVDDSPCGGGPGMVMKPEPWWEALDALVPAGGEAGDPAGRAARPRAAPFTQAVRRGARRAPSTWSSPAARYEGIDRRFVEAAAERMPVDELSIGDYVLAGGEVAVLVMVEAVGRLLPGVLGNAESAKDDSFAEGAMSGLLEAPSTPSPRPGDGREVPPTLLSGNHALVARWRRDAALARTAEMRPDLIAALDPKDTDKKDRALLASLGWWETPGGFRPAADPVAD